MVECSAKMSACESSAFPIGTPYHVTISKRAVSPPFGRTAILEDHDEMGVGLNRSSQGFNVESRSEQCDIHSGCGNHQISLPLYPRVPSRAERNIEAQRNVERHIFQIEIFFLSNCSWHHQLTLIKSICRIWTPHEIYKNGVLFASNSC